MNDTEILSQLQTIFCDVLDNEDVVLSRLSTAGDVDGWDSLAHLQLVVAIEKHFGIRFTSEEMFEWKKVGDMIGTIEARLA
ncbi:acyl carrier protein [Spirochaetia bacterium]|nr:acyl carrier protein [Spirochaetia bacterium]